MNAITATLSVIAEQISPFEGGILIGLLAIIALALLLPQRTRKRRRAFASRDEQFQRLQKL